MSSPSTGFKQCRRCQGTMSITDPHRKCLWCLGVDHQIDDCSCCQAMRPKTLRERRAKLASGPPENRARGKSRSRKGSSASLSRSTEPREVVRIRDKEQVPRRHPRKSPSRSPSSPPRRTREEPRGGRPQTTGVRRRSSPSPSRSRTRPHRDSASSKSSHTSSRRPRSRSPRRRTPTSEGTGGHSSPQSSHRGSSTRPPSRSDLTKAPTPPTEDEWKRQYDSLMSRLPPSMRSKYTAPTPREEELPVATSTPRYSPPATSVPGQSEDPHLGPPRVGGAGARAKSAGPHVARAVVHAPSECTRAETIPGSTLARPGATPMSGRTLTAPERPTGPRSVWVLADPSRSRDCLDEDPVSEGEEEYLQEPSGWGPVHTLHNRLGYASGLDTSPECDLSQPEDGFYPEQSSGYWHVMKLAAQTLGIELPTPERTKNVLTEILDAPEDKGAAAIPFHAGLSEPLIELWEHPNSLSAVPPKYSRKYKPLVGDPTFVREHPLSDSLVVQAATVKSSVTSFPTLPPDRDSKRIEGFAKKVFASGSLGLRALNSTCTIFRLFHSMFKDLQVAIGELPETVPKESLSYLATEGLEAAKQGLVCGLDSTDAVGRVIATAIAMRRHAWLRTSHFAPDVQSKLMDMPFDGSHLFGEKAEEALLKFSTSHKMAQDYRPIAPAPRGFSFNKRRPWYQRNQAPAAKRQLPGPQKQFQLPSRGRGKGRGKGQRRAGMKEVSPATQQQS